MGTRGEQHADRRNPQHHGGGTAPGQNVGPDLTEREQPLPTAYDVKALHRALDGVPDDELKQIPVLPAGARLQQGATYVDLADERREEFKATGSITAEPGHYYVPKDRVPYTIWNRLIGEPKPGQERPGT